MVEKEIKVRRKKSVFFAVKAVSQKLMSQAEAARFFEVSETASILSTHQVNAIKKIIETKTPDQLKLPFLLWS
jgi:hypothetical protein